MSSGAVGTQRYGLLASHQYPRTQNLREQLGELFGLVEYGAELGYDSVFAIHHYVANLQTPQVTSMVASLLPYSGEMQVGTAIMLATFMHPVQIAEEFATLDQLSNGRIVLGVGSGYRDDEFDAFGLDKTTRGARLAETVEVVRALWQDEPVHHEGRFYRLDGQRISVPPLQPGGPEIWIGAGAFPAIRRAARLGDAWLAPGNPPTAGWFDEAVGEYDAALAERQRTPSRRPVIVELFCAATDEEARAQAEPFVRDEYFTYSDYKQLSWQKSRFDYLWDEVFLIGSPETIARKIIDLRSHGFDHIIHRPFWIGMPIEMARESIRLVATEVRPRVEELIRVGN